MTVRLLAAKKEPRKKKTSWTSTATSDTVKHWTRSFAAMLIHR
jgi:hypothetical protein